jgi:hypothetical protein
MRLKSNVKRVLFDEQAFVLPSRSPGKTFVAGITSTLGRIRSLQVLFDPRPILERKRRREETC